MSFQKAQEKCKVAAAAKKQTSAAAQPRGAPRKGRRWGGEHELVESGGVGHVVGAWVPGVLDAGDEHEDDVRSCAE